MLTALEDGVKGGVWFSLIDKVYSAKNLESAFAQVQAWTEQVDLQLHPEKTRLVDATQQDGFDFLGYHFECGRRWPSKKSLSKLRDAIRAKTRRTNGRSLPSIITTVNRTLRGWFKYFKHSHPTTFKPIDGWVRMRLRSILRHRSRRRGVGRGPDHWRWPNKFFAARGLFSMLAAYGAPGQPRPG